MCLGKYAQLSRYLGVSLAVVSWLSIKPLAEHTFQNALPFDTRLYVVEDILLA